jgi:FkbM family methyltransferase
LRTLLKEVAHAGVSKLSSTLFDGFEYTVRNGLLKGLKRKGGLGWLPLERGQSAEIRFWQEYPLAGKTVFDVGAFHGLLTLHFARRAARVVAFEPNPVNRHRLEENIRLNGFSGKVLVRPYGLAKESCTANMSMDSRAHGTASVDPGLATGSNHFSVPLERLDDERVFIPDLVKIDVEGFEAEVLEGGERMLREHMPDLCLEMHGDGKADKIRRTTRVLNLLLDFGYQHIVHIESGLLIGIHGAETSYEGHLFASSRAQPGASLGDANR